MLKIIPVNKKIFLKKLKKELLSAMEFFHPKWNPQKKSISNFGN